MAKQDSIIEALNEIIESIPDQGEQGYSASDRKTKRFFRQFKRNYREDRPSARKQLVNAGLDLDEMGTSSLLRALRSIAEKDGSKATSVAALKAVERAQVREDELFGEEGEDAELARAETVTDEEEIAEDNAAIARIAADAQAEQDAIWAQAEADLAAREDALYGVGDDDLGLLAGEGPDGGSPTDADNPYTEAPLLDLAQQTGVLGMEEGNPLGVEATDSFYEVQDDFVADGGPGWSEPGGNLRYEIVDRESEGPLGDTRTTYSFEEMIARRQGARDWGLGIEEPVVPQLQDKERAPGVNPDETGENNWRSTAGNALGLLGSAAGLAQPFVDQYMQKDWEDMLRASARGDTVARQEGAIASGRALQGMMGSSLGRRDISPALAMRNAQTSSRNLLRDIYGQQLVASAQERRLAEEKLAQIRSQRWQKALGTVGELGSQAGAWLSKEGAKQSAGPVTAGMKNSGGGGGNATGQ